MLSDEEKEKLKQEFQYALDNIVSKIKGETATAIVVSEQSMILLFTKLMLKIEKQSKEIEELKEKNKTLKSLQNDTNGLYIEMTERKNYFERELQKVEDKIKAKIEELIKEGNYRTADNPNGRVHFQKEFTDYQIEVLQSLLEKE